MSDQYFGYAGRTMDIKIRNKKIDEELFLKMHQKVLSEWPTGKEVDLDEAVGMCG